MSSVSSGGVGGNLGGTMQPTARDLETSAWSLVNKEQLGIVRDSIEVPFTKIGGNVWKYSSDSSRPTLMPTGTLRTMGEDLAKPNESWKQKFDELVNKLPPDLKETLMSELGKRAEQRSVNYQVLTQTLTTLAKGLSWMDSAQESADPSSVEGKRTIDNRSLPGRALKGMVSHGRSMLQGAAAHLDKVGPNNPHHDALRYFSKEGEELQGRMEAFLNILSDPNEELPTPEQMNKLCDDIGTLSQEFNKVSHGDQLQIMGPMLESMQTVAQALSVTPTSPSLFIGLKAALKGIFASESSTGILGGDLEALIAALQSGMLSTLMKKMGPAKMKMLMMMLMSALGGSGTLGSIMGERPINRYADEEDEEDKEEQKFSFIMLLEMLKSTELIKLLYQIIAEACGQEPKAQDKTAMFMELISLLLIALAGVEGKFNQLTPFLQELDLSDKLHTAEKFVNEALLSGEVNGSTAMGLNIALQQARLALADNNFESLTSILKGALKYVNATPEGLSKDLGKIKKFSELIKYALGSGLESETKVVTGMISAA